jgi:type I restriction enzyme S subunit
VITRESVNGRFPVRTLGAIVAFLDSKRRPVKESDRREGPYPYYGANGQQGTIDEFIFDEPLVLLAEDGGHFGSPGRSIAYRIQGKSWVNNHAHVLRPTPDVDIAFLYHVLKHYDVTPFVTGTTRGKLTQAGAAEIPIPLPPIEDQRRIAEVLDRADALRTNRRSVLTKWEDLKRAIFLDVFGDPANNTHGWQQSALGSICTIAGEYGAGVAAKEYDPRLPRYVRITDVTADGGLTPLAMSPAGDPTDWTRFTLDAGDLLFARSGATVGKTYLHRSAHGRCVFAGYLIRFRPDTSKVLPEYLFHFTRTRAYQAWVAARQRVVAQPNINAQQYGRELTVPVPPLDLQRAFQGRIAMVHLLEAACEASLLKVQTLIASLHSRAFRGEL